MNKVLQLPTDITKIWQEGARALANKYMRSPSGAADSTPIPIGFRASESAHGLIHYEYFFSWRSRTKRLALLHEAGSSAGCVSLDYFTGAAEVDWCIANVKLKFASQVISFTAKELHRFSSGKAWDSPFLEAIKGEFQWVQHAKAAHDKRLIFVLKGMKTPDYFNKAEMRWSVADLSEYILKRPTIWDWISTKRAALEAEQKLLKC